MSVSKKQQPTPAPATSQAATNLNGTITVPGDKSISHRALILASQCVGHSTIHGLLESEDVLHTAAALKQMGITIEKSGDTYTVQGRGVGGLVAPDAPLYMGNAGTAARLLMGLLATHPFTSVFDGDASLRKRPMQRVIIPLEEMGAIFTAEEGGRLPITLQGAEEPLPITYTAPVPSAQLKSAILLAGLNTPGATTVIEPTPTRDHTERMLRYLGTEVTETHQEEGNHITITGHPELEATEWQIPGDPSSAAFFLVAALITPDSSITVENIGINPARIGLLETLNDMGADITLSNERELCGEPVADITARTSQLTGITVPASRAPSMIDEYPILAVAAACAEGKTQMEGLAELRVKESDRLTAIAEGLAACGVTVETTDDSLTVHGGAPEGGATITTHMDHRIAMSFLILGLVSKNPITIDDSSMIATSFPGFIDLLNSVGAQLTHGA